MKNAQKAIEREKRRKFQRAALARMRRRFDPQKSKPSRARRRPTKREVDAFMSRYGTPLLKAFDAFETARYKLFGYDQRRP